jgi:uncharacterized metal-binding protein
MRCHDCRLDHSCTNGRNCTPWDIEEHAARYDEQSRRLLDAAAEVEAEGYLELTRLEEFALFCRKLGVERVGLAFCIGSAEEAAVVGAFLERRGFAVSSACCKLGGVPKERFDHPPVAGSSGGSCCNPLGQGAILERDGCSIIGSIGLCVGHDALLNHGAAVPVVTLIAKDRVTGHNPAAVIYNQYLRRRLE